MLQVTVIGVLVTEFFPFILSAGLTGDSQALDLGLK